MGTLYPNDMLSSVREDHVNLYPAVADRKSRPILVPTITLTDLLGRGE